MTRPNVNYDQLLTPALRGHWIVSTPDTYDVAIQGDKTAARCDGFLHEVYDPHGHKLGEARTRGLALELIRHGSGNVEGPGPKVEGPATILTSTSTPSTLNPQSSTE